MEVFVLLFILVILIACLMAKAYDEGKKDAERKIATDILFHRLAPSGNLLVYLSRLVKRHYNGCSEWNNLHLRDPYEMYFGDGPSDSEANKKDSASANNTRHIDIKG